MKCFIVLALVATVASAQYLQDTPEVNAAKAEFFATYDAAARQAAPAQQYQQQPQQYQQQQPQQYAAQPQQYAAQPAAPADKWAYVHEDIPAIAYEHEEIAALPYQAYVPSRKQSQQAYAPEPQQYAAQPQQYQQQQQQYAAQPQQYQQQQQYAAQPQQYQQQQYAQQAAPQKQAGGCYNNKGEGVECRY